MRIRSWKCHPDFPFGSESSFRGCWEFELQSGEQTIPHLHDDGDEINITLEGTGQITVGEVSREVSPGGVVYIPARTSHFIENPSSPILRGISVETGVDLPTEVSPEERLTVHNLGELIRTIPDELDESQALHLIIQLFDVAGHLSEQIENAIGLESQNGYGALQELQRQVMDAVVKISGSYQSDAPDFRRRF